MSITNIDRYLSCNKLLAPAVIVAGLWTVASLNAADMPNACPVDGCEVTIVSVDPAEGDELLLMLEANFTPDNARNHLHMWWGEQYNVKQVGRNAKSEFGVEQGKWHRHDSYPEYTTTGAASVTVRDGSSTLCVTAADRDHNVLDAELFHCVDVSKYLPD
jgi:hypothetical protein